MFSKMKLGKKPVDPVRYAKVPSLLDHVDVSSTLPLIADATDYKKRMTDAGGVLGNDQYGDCGFAGFAHLKQGICANLGISCNITTDLVLQWYSQCTGFKASDPNTDNGVVLLDAIRFFMKKGLILAYGTVDVSNPAHVAAALELCGGLYTGWSLPFAWQSTATWSTNPNGSSTGNWKPGSWGGHCVSAHKYDASMNLTIDSWGEWIYTTDDARPVYCDEAYGFILPEWFDSKGKTLQGFDLDGLRAKLALLD